MSDIFITIITIMAVALLLFIFPLISVTSQDEAITKMDVQALVSTFANTVSKEGKITLDNYDEFVQKLYATGNAYEIEIEVQILDDTLSREGTEKYVIGESLYYSEFTSAIEKELRENGKYDLKQGDYIKVKVENTNETFGTQLKRFLYGAIGKEEVVIDVSSASAMIGRGADSGEIPQNQQPVPPKPPAANLPEIDEFIGGLAPVASAEEMKTKWLLTYRFYCKIEGHSLLADGFQPYWTMPTHPFNALRNFPSENYYIIKGQGVQISTKRPTIGHGYKFAGWQEIDLLDKSWKENPTVTYKPGDWVTIDKHTYLVPVWEKDGVLQFVKVYKDANGDFYWGE